LLALVPERGEREKEGKGNSSAREGRERERGEGEQGGVSQFVPIAYSAHNNKFVWPLLSS